MPQGNEARQMETKMTKPTLDSLQDQIDRAMKEIEFEREADGSSDSWWRKLIERILRAADESTNDPR